MEKHSVIVIGAGMSGIMATKTLHDAGIDVICLEARDRIGGRTHTDKSLGISADLGASWIHGPIGNPITPLADKHGVTYGATDFANRSRAVVSAFDDDGTPLNENEYADGLQLAKAAFIAEHGSILHERPEGGRTLKDFVDAGFPLQEQLTTRAMELGFRYWSTIRMEYSNAADLDTIDWELGGNYATLPGDDLLVWGGGFNGITDQLIDGLDMRAGVVVQSIHYGDGETRLVTSGGEFSAEHVILTVPLGILKAGVIAFDPPLPEEKVGAIGRIGYGNYEKLVMRFDKFYWPQDKQRFNYLSEALDGEPTLFNAWLNIGHYNGEPTIIAYHAGRRARHINRWSDGEMMERALEVMQRIFGDNGFGEIPAPVAYVRTGWESDQFALGSYSFDEIGQQEGDRQRLAAPVGNQLYFAGEATHPHYYATVHGAYESGVRAARDVLANLRN